MTPFEPLESAPIRFLTLKMFFNGHYFSYENWGFAGSVNLAILPRLCPWAGQNYFAPSPKLSSESSMNPIVLEAFCPPPFTTPEQKRLHLLCPVRALQIYVHRTSQWCKSEQLFICYGGRNRGAAATKHTVSHWVRDAIALAYEARGQASPLRVRAHSTRGVASSMALARGAPLQQVCDAAGWSSPHTFVRVYSLKCSCYSGLARP